MKVTNMLLLIFCYHCFILEYPYCAITLKINTPHEVDVSDQTCTQGNLKASGISKACILYTFGIPRHAIRSELPTGQYIPTQADDPRNILNS